MEFIEVASADDLAEGQMRVADVHGKRILLALVEGRIYAIGAVCTHERAHLDEGTLDGYELYCPRHFSCFDVRTGEALEPPADRPEPVYAVKVEGGKVLVSGSPVDPEMLEEAAATAAAAPAEAEPPTDGAAEPEPADAAPDGAPAADRVAPAMGVRPVGAEHEAPAHEQKGPPRVRPRFAPAGAAAWQQRMLELAEDLPWLENGAETLGSALRPVRESPAGRRVFDLLHGRILGHALHPALSDLPIGMWSGSVLLDTVGEHQAAGVLGLAGACAGVATAVTGVADWTVSDGRDRRAGLLHGILQTVALGLEGGSLIARRTGHVGSARALAAAGLGVATGSAYIGGHLVFGRGVMVDHTAWRTGPRQWTRAIREDELPDGDVQAVDVDGRTVLLSRTDGVVSAIDAVCSHAGGPLSRGKIKDGVVTCPRHGSCFRLADGTVVRGPAHHPQPELETRAMTDGWIEVRGRQR
jgi:nitrite reductase/ring-hydroxylating ferredoxin subunit